jgi:hypothetical protein
MTVACLEDRLVTKTTIYILSCIVCHSNVAWVVLRVACVPLARIYRYTEIFEEIKVSIKISCVELG